MIKEKLTLIGAGNMGEALLKGLLGAKVFSPEQISVVETSALRRDYISKNYRVSVKSDTTQAASQSDIIILAVKPQIMGQILEELALSEELTSSINASKLVISIAAGVKIAFLAEKLGQDRQIVRVMPNTPALVGAGISAVCGSQELLPENLAIARTIFEAVGRVVEVEEKLMDAVTALSGSGPAYIFLIIEALSDAGVSLGLSRPTALELAAQTVFGSAKLLLEKQEHPAKLKDMVTSPGGTTIAGLQALEKGALRATLTAAVQAAARRSQELGEPGGSIQF